MAIATIQTIIPGMMLVTKLNRLLPLNPLPRVPGRAIQFRGHPERGNQDKNRAIDRQLRERVCAVVKNLGHRSGLLIRFYRILQSELREIHPIEKP